MTDASKNPGSDADRPQEYPAVKTTIVGGRPPGCGKPLGPIPRGIEVLVKKAAVDPEFKFILMRDRAWAAQEIGLVLDAAEATMLNLIPAPQLEAIIARTTVDPRVKPAFLGRAAAVMLVALGATAIQLTSAQDATRRGITETWTPPPPPTTTATTSAPTTQDQKPETMLPSAGALVDVPRPAVAGVRVYTPATSPASEPATAPAPASEPMPGPSAGVRAPGPGQLKQPIMRAAGIRVGGITADEPATSPASAPTTAPADQGELQRPVRAMPMDGVRPDLPRPVKMAGLGADTPDTPPTTQPATTTQASQPTTWPTVTREQILPILKDLDAEAFKVRQDAQAKLQGLGAGALQPLREILKTETLSLEVTTRVKSAMSCLLEN